MQHIQNSHCLCRGIASKTFASDILECTLGNKISHGIVEGTSRNLQKVQIGETGWNTQRQYSGFWTKKVNHRQFFDWLGTQLGYKEMDDWYSVTQQDIHRSGGSGLLNEYYSGAPSK